jgi:rsbT co-antagonist protein RsbR
MPLVGALDTTRLRQVQEQSLYALESTSAHTMVFDITSVPIVDTQVAQGLLMTVRAARLLGAEVVLVGIHPEVAQSIVGLGLDLHDVSTFSDLQSALDRVAA